MIRYADILNESVVDGVGIRVVVFLQGCPRHCFGCHNAALLTPEGGKQVSEEQLAADILQRLSPLHYGVTFSGGDPLLQAESLNRVISLIREQKPDLNIWVYTGYHYEEVARLPVLRQIDVLVDGPFQMKERSLLLAFRGSANQRVIDMRESRQTGKLVFLPVHDKTAAV